MFNTRQIHEVGVNATGRELYIDFDSTMAVVVYQDIIDLVDGQSFRFARRSFAGATRLVFVYNPLSGHYGFQGEYISEEGIKLCANKCWNLLGVGRKTKTFSLWFKRGTK